MAFGTKGKVHVVPFWKKPQRIGATCHLHPDGGGCWRCESPLHSQIIKLPPSGVRRSVSLVPRAASLKSGAGPTNLHLRCFQLVGDTEKETSMMNQGLDVAEFVEDAAAQMRSLFNEDPDAKADLHVLWGY